MKKILEDITTGQLKNYYLIYGEERALMLQYREKLKQAICPDGDEMNITRFHGKGTSIQEVEALANTLPFFSEHRLIIIENSGWFGSSNDFADHMDEFPDTTYIVFLEEKVDKRNRLYKAVSKIGYASEFLTPGPDALAAKIVRDCEKAGKRITREAVDYIIENAGESYGFVCMELDKLLNYVEGKDAINLQDVEEICHYQAKDKIFVMIDAIGNQNREQAVRIYHDLVYLRKPIPVILSNLNRMINLLLQICEMTRLNLSVSEMSKRLGLKEGVVRKYIGQLKHYDYERLRRMQEECQDMVTAMRRGDYSDELGVELLIVGFASPDQ